MKRHYLGQEYLSLGSVSKSYLATVFSCSRQTIQKGYEEVIAPDFKPDYNRQRKEGGGRKKRGGIPRTRKMDIEYRS